MTFARHLEIILDARMIMHSGIGSHIRGLLEGWREIAPDFRPTLLGDPEAIEESGGRFGPRHVITFRAPIYGLREQTAFPAKACRGKLLHCPHYNVALRHRGPLVVTLHDLIHIHEQWGVPSAWKRMYGRWMLRKAVRRAGHIFTVSHCTAGEIAERLKVDREKISVAYNAPSRLFREADPSPEAVAQFRRKCELPARYLLTVGLYKPHKNLDRLLEALHSLWREGDLSSPLVMAGVQAKDRPALEARIASLDLGDRARVLDRLPAEDLPLLYAERMP